MVLHHERDSEFRRSARLMLAAFRKFESVSVGKLHVNVIGLDYTDPDNLREALKTQKIIALYLAPGLDGSVSAISEVAREAKVRTLTGCGQYVSDGIAIGAILRGARLRLVVNLKAAKAEGMDLSARLLGIAQVINR